MSGGRTEPQCVHGVETNIEPCPFCKMAEDALARVPKPKLTVVEFGYPNLMDISSCLRKLADRIEKGDLSDTESALVILGDFRHEVTVYGYGRHVDSRLASIGWLEFAKKRLLD